MRGWQQESPGAGAGAGAAAPVPEAQPLQLTSPLHQEAARLLANMALNQLKPSSSAPPL
jgi:hypothetical protein